MMDIVIGMLPFFSVMILLMIALIYYPPLATWLPKLMMG
jgi:TRAP-type C4-dicarboxylate transport system permease large subunit